MYHHFAFSFQLLLFSLQLMKISKIKKFWIIKFKNNKYNLLKSIQFDPSKWLTRSRQSLHAHPSIPRKWKLWNSATNMHVHAFISDMCSSMYMCSQVACAAPTHVFTHIHTVCCSSCACACMYSGIFFRLFGGWEFLPPENGFAFPENNDLYDNTSTKSSSIPRKWKPWN